jgi:beta-galactosidase
MLERYPAVLGEFVWTGFDYLGEPTPYNNDATVLLNFSTPEEREMQQKKLEEMGKIQVPSRSSYFGIIDLCGFPKDRFYNYQAHWRPDLPMAHILPHWNWPEREGQITPVHVYTSGDEAELFLNGKSQGRKKKGEYEYRLRWENVHYAPGELRVVAYKNGKKWAEESIHTTGKPAVLQLEADRPIIQADGKDLCFVTLRVLDAQGRMVPTADLPIHFSLEGSGKIIATGNGNAACHESFQSPDRTSFNGLALAIIQGLEDTPDTLILHAEAKGMQSAEIKIKTQ